MTALRDELERLGIIETTESGQLKLLSQGYVSTDIVEGIHILGTDTADLIDTISHNLNADDSPTRFQRKVSYVGIPDQFVEPLENTLPVPVRSYWKISITGWRFAMPPRYATVTK